MRTAPFEAEHMTAPDQVAAPPVFPCTEAVVHTCPRCAGSEYCEIRGRQLLQCRQCRHQTSLIAGTVLQGTKLPMRVWFRAMHLLAQGKKGLSNIELGRRLGISTKAAWRVQHKLMQAMIERDRRYKLGASGPRIEIGDAYIGSERTGEGSCGGRSNFRPLRRHRTQASSTDGSKGRKVLIACIIWNFSGARS